jgi:Co/Zn/Cd efflux system component
VSHQIILSPAPKTPLQVPVTLPVPTANEFRSSMTIDQKKRLLWCFCHLSVAAYVQMTAHDSVSMTTLSHLLFFDALGAFLYVAVDVARNFDVWNKSSISHPFGLERSEVLAGLATNIVLLFMGLDLMSHGIKDTLGDGAGHHIHVHETHKPAKLGTINLPALFSIGSTFLSALILNNRPQMDKSMRKSSHFLPISLAILLIIISLLGIEPPAKFDTGLSLLYASAMVFFGSRLCYRIGRMLLMSYSGTGVPELVDEIRSDPGVSSIEEAKVWQVHYSLCMANFKLKARSADQVERLRERIATLVKNRLGGGYGDGSKGVRWEVSSQITIE